ncbi:hypothetical protein DU68_01485 [Methanosarcina mazei]|uniref:Glycosyltransferase subfamily 4-like N-terminal domain-containing protein n=1 Tax=Methanosarcina mazei TaxID=2209 RepID=A0A0F8KFV9_METMZ|nr:glycosyltransferase [Methanosarcina mazei]KKG99373.1 hypothetical protein DU56_04720 [Methanosarcina mazei]KKH00366.1 hypothetical protein DU66_09395 [Methanosarcina mazei]KKH02835.1 hypothetical protein DU68_01485 [Methanosarcina mazei]
MNLLTFSSANKGGGSIVKLIELISGLSKRGWLISYISPKDFAPLNDNITHYNIFNVFFMNGFFYLFQVLITSLYILIVKRIKVDRIVVFSLLDGFLACLLSIFFRRSKIIVALHGDWHTGIQLKKQNYIIKKLYIYVFCKIEQIVFSKSDLILFVSNENFVRITNRTKININKTKIIYNNINNPRTLTSDNMDKIQFNERKVIGFVGNLFAKDKGVEVLIRAFEQVLKKIKDIRLVIVGDGPDNDYLSILCTSLNIQDYVTFTGYLENPFPYLKSFDVYVLPSLHEGFNLSILEALYCDNVVLGSRVGGTPEALLYDELLFDPLSIDELAFKINNLVTDENLYLKYLCLCNKRKKKFTFDWIRDMEKEILNTV